MCCLALWFITRTQDMNNLNKATCTNEYSLCVYIYGVVLSYIRELVYTYTAAAADTEVFQY